MDRQNPPFDIDTLPSAYTLIFPSSLLASMFTRMLLLVIKVTSTLEWWHTLQDKKGTERGHPEASTQRPRDLILCRQYCQLATYSLWILTNGSARTSLMSIFLPRASGCFPLHQPSDVGEEPPVGVVRFGIYHWTCDGSYGLWPSRTQNSEVF